MLKQKIRDKKQNTTKLCLNNLDKKYCFVPFFGTGNIINEQSGLKNIKRLLGKPNKNLLDDRENRVLKYNDIELSFIFLKILSKSTKKPLLLFITNKNPFIYKQQDSIYSGLDRTDVNFRMREFSHSEVIKMKKFGKVRRVAK